MYLRLIELNSIRMIDTMCQVHQHNLQKGNVAWCFMMLHDSGSIKHTGLVVETQAVVSNDISRPQGIIGTICWDKGPSVRWTNHKTSSIGNDWACNVPLLRAYSVGHFRSEPRTKTAHASDQTCLGLNPHASDQIPMPQTNTPRTNAPCLGAMARNSHGPLRPKRHILVPLCFGTLSLVIIVFIILSLSIVVAYYCLPITIYSPLY